MTRMLAFVAALLMSGLAVSSACVAGNVEPVGFTIEPTIRSDQVQVRFRRADQQHTNSWSSTFRTEELAGLDVAALQSAGTRALRFTIARDAGRIDCAGSGGNAMARGTCTVTADAGFNDVLAASGIARPTKDQTFGLIAVDARRDLIAALRTAGYPAPSVNKLMELSAVGVTPAYIRELSAQGYRPDSLQSLVEFRAMDITPEFIGSFARAGYSDLDPSDLVQLKALDITPEFIVGFERIGYGRLPVSTLVQLKALNVTPEFVRAVQTGDSLPSPERLVMLRALGDDIRDR